MEAERHRSQGHWVIGFVNRPVKAAPPSSQGAFSHLQQLEVAKTEPGRQAGALRPRVSVHAPPAARGTRKGLEQ